MKKKKEQLEDGVGEVNEDGIDDEEKEEEEVEDDEGW